MFGFSMAQQDEEFFCQVFSLVRLVASLAKNHSSCVPDLKVRGKGEDQPNNEKKSDGKVVFSKMKGYFE